MPREVRDEYSGAIIYVPTDEDREAAAVGRLLVHLYDEVIPASKRNALPEDIRDALDRLRGKYG